MRHVIAAPPVLEVSTFARRLAKGRSVIADPARLLVQRLGYQTLYEVPVALQKQLRREVIRKHAESLRRNPDSVWDHSVFSMLADWMRWLWSATPTEEWESVLVDAWPAVERSESIQHVISAPRAGYDGYLWLDAGNAKQVERLMRALYRDFDCEDRVTEVTVGP